MKIKCDRKYLVRIDQAFESLLNSLASLRIIIIIIIEKAWNKENFHIHCLSVLFFRKEQLKYKNKKQAELKVSFEEKNPLKKLVKVNCGLMIALDI